MRRTYLTIALLFVSTTTSYGQTTYFLVADFDPNFRTDSYVLPLTEPNDIAHARDLIANGPGVGTPLVVADIVCGADGINRNFLSPSKNQWLWHITQFTGFADMTIEILDGSPTMVNNDCTWWMTNTGKIGFWGYTVIAEIGENPKPWRCNFDWTGTVNLKDLAYISSRFMNSCSPADDFCNWVDINQDGTVDIGDLVWFADAWLSPYAFRPITFSTAWTCPYQCHGDANCQADGTIVKHRVSTTDLNIYLSVYNTAKPWPALCGQLGYDPRADFDRDCDVDDNDGQIINTWLNASNVPADCPIENEPDVINP